MVSILFIIDVVLLKCSRQLEQKARDIFLVVGNNLQKRRLLDYSRDFGRSVTDRLRCI